MSKGGGDDDDDNDNYGGGRDALSLWYGCRVGIRFNFCGLRVKNGIFFPYKINLCATVGGEG